MGYEIKMTMGTSSLLAPDQIIGEAFDDYKKNHKIDKLSIHLLKIKEI